MKRTDIEKEVLHLSMIDGMDGSFLGEVIVPLSTVNETSGCENWYTLQEKVRLVKLSLSLSKIIMTLDLYIVLAKLVRI